MSITHYNIVIWALLNNGNLTISIDHFAQPRSPITKWSQKLFTSIFIRFLSQECFIVVIRS